MSEPNYPVVSDDQISMLFGGAKSPEHEDNENEGADEGSPAETVEPEATTDTAEDSGARKMAAKTKEPAEDVAKEGDDIAETLETLLTKVSALDYRLGSVQSDVNKRMGDVGRDTGEMLPSMIDAISKTLETSIQDLNRATTAARNSTGPGKQTKIPKSKLAGVAFGALFAGLIAGAGAVYMFMPPQTVEVVKEDPSGGWSDYMWATHGDDLLGCYRVSKNASSEVDCNLRVDYAAVPPQ